jgi:hypothetical protein
MKKYILTCVSILAVASMVSQVSFTEKGSLLGNYDVHSSAGIDMNGDYLDDYVRVSENGIGIDYQQADQTFNSVWIPIEIQNIPTWSIAAGDLDENGYNDLILGNGSAVSFLFANADGTSYTLQDFPEYIFSQRTTMADIDNDGDLDAFVCHDVDLSHPYRNDGNGNMTLDQTLIETIDAPGNYAAIWVDYDNDGDTDMYLTKCRGGSSPGDPERDNAMYTNDGTGVFVENAQDIGMRDNAQSWATVFEDFDNDGDFDAFIVNHDFNNRFMLNDGSGVFNDIIETTGIDSGDLGAWENQAGDFDNNGFVDIFSEMASEIYLNNGDLTFTGMNLNFDEGAIGDFNNDGFLDVMNAGNFYENNGNSNNWVKVGLLGTTDNTNGIGARIQILGDWGTQMREIRSGQGFSHMSSLIGHFGIGTSTAIDEVIVTWPDGTVDIVTNPDINTQIIIEQGSSPLAITDFQKEGLSIYPNPAIDVATFSLAGLQNTPVRVIDVNGKVVLNSIVSSENSINIAALRKGIYFVQIEIEKKTVNYKLLKK